MKRVPSSIHLSSLLHYNLHILCGSPLNSQILHLGEQKCQKRKRKGNLVCNTKNKTGEDILLPTRDSCTINTNDI